MESCFVCGLAFGGGIEIGYDDLAGGGASICYLRASY